MPDEPATEDTFRKLVELIEILRSDEGCPWDREQTMESLVECLREETEEVVEAVENGDMDNLREELGDLILQGVFYAQIASEERLFDIDDVLNTVNEKLVTRHPHVFEDEEVKGAEGALEKWEERKKARS